MTSTILLQKIKKRSSEILSEVIDIRRHLHAHPELSFQEFATSEFVCAKLNELNIEYTKGWVKTGIVAIIKGKNPLKKTIALRADLDALPILEENKVSYCSTNKGVMHACGHDVHTACLLGVAKILQELKDEFEGTVKFIFQPGEEKLPGGASLLIKEGVLKNPEPNSIFGQHVAPQLISGKVGFRSGMYMASADELYLTVTGKGGHAALPHQYNNPLLIAAEILLALNKEFGDEKLQLNQKIKNKEDIIPTVLAFGKIHAEGATNVIPDKVFIEGTFRTLNEIWRAEAHRIMKEIAERIATELKGTCDFRIALGYPFLVNNPEVTQRAKNAAIEYLGKDNVVDLDLRMTSEDFAFYSQLVPACFYRLGTGFLNNNPALNVHTSTFDVNENSLEIGVGLMTWLAMNDLQN
ncbi:MAG TPA: M20 family metallopeptidase [Bacteroidia bacterium]|nr:M20 family metallopeptidase [Bacteroidia bacterium]HRH07986.1 M20 family metallopeptidase [Bacteroidia bacterium]HRH63118.1 M20 family metallopeptidase [Bacteroidia bacterium]